jgi:ribonuclease HII
MKIPRKTLERTLLAQGYGRIIGVDEVGMACLAGPVVVCALAAGPEFYEHRYPQLAGMRDSKLLQPHQRERFARELEGIPGLQWRIASCEPQKIDEINIYQASRVAMREAIADLRSDLQKRFNLGSVERLNLVVLVDGNKDITELNLPQQHIVGGDRKIWTIAAASILAKVHRDRLMIDYATQYPGYGFERHKGYPTALHRARLAVLGPCALHRRSFSFWA